MLLSCRASRLYKLSIRPHLITHTSLSRCLFSTAAASHPANKTQIYLLRSHDPFINLSIEHHLLQRTSPESTVLLLYTNRPSVVFGRNQNPWLEVNLARLAQIRQQPESVPWAGDPVQLVRRRSGGGTVFHDDGNVNFSVICPPAVFNRDKHAEMVVRALKSLGKPNTRVNERHDIVTDVSSTGKAAQASTFKISGSAYKLTRLRSLHHGTCLLHSPNLASISGMLRSPAEAFIKAQGVDSVRSPVRNIDLDGAAFADAVIAQFESMYGPADIRQEVGEEALETEEIRQGYGELQSRDWIYGQTPRFVFSTRPTEQDPRPRRVLPFDLHLNFEARHGILEKFSVRGRGSASMELDESPILQISLQDVDDWSKQLAQAGLGTEDARSLGTWMDNVLGVGFTKPRH